MKQQILRLVIRWFVCSFGLWATAGLFSQDITDGSSVGVIIIAGGILAIINSVIRPLVVVLSMPAILFSLGFFMIIINGLMVLLVSKLYTPLKISGFGMAMFAGMVIGLVNYLVSTLVEDKVSK